MGQELLCRTRSPLPQPILVGVVAASSIPVDNDSQTSFLGLFCVFSLLTSPARDETGMGIQSTSIADVFVDRFVVVQQSDQYYVCLTLRGTTTPEDLTRVNVLNLGSFCQLQRIFLEEELSSNIIDNTDICFADYCGEEPGGKTLCSGSSMDSNPFGPDLKCECVLWFTFAECIAQGSHGAKYIWSFEDVLQ